MGKTKKIYQFNFNNGYAYSIGSGFGSDSFSGTGYLNFPEGYIYLRNLIYREDGILRPMFAGSNLGNTVGSNAIRGISAGETDTLYAVSGTPSIHYSENNGATWAAATWSGDGDAGSLPDEGYDWASYANDEMICKAKDAGEPTYYITTS